MNWNVVAPDKFEVPKAVLMGVIGRLPGQRTRTNHLKLFIGWPCDPQVESLIMVSTASSRDLPQMQLPAVSSMNVVDIDREQRVQHG